jgi:LysW-gamma-L-lysine carboxypeptidase
MNVVAAAWPGIPVVAYGPGDSALDHAPGERLDLGEYRKSIEVLKGVLHRLVEGTRTG